MRNISRLLPLLIVPVLLGGCRYKGWESFSGATNSVTTAKPLGDPYSFGSLAPATGGLKTTTNYGAGASMNGKGKLNPVLDQPAMGSGQRAGVYSTAAAPGYGEDNGAALQPQPDSMTDTAPAAHG